MKTFNGHNKNAARIIALTAALAVLYIVGMGVYYYHLMTRVSEDAYATAIWTKANRCAEEMEMFIESLASDLANQAPAIVSRTPSDTSLHKTLSWHQDAVSHVFKLDLDGVRTPVYSQKHQNNKNYDSTVSSNALARAGQGMATLCYSGNNHVEQNYFSLFVPVFDASLQDFIIEAVIPVDFFYTRFLSTLKHSPVEAVRLTDQTGKLIIMSSRHIEPETPKKHRKILREESLIMAEKPETAVYAITLSNDKKQIEIYKTISFPGAEWTITAAIPYRIARLAPHAFFKGSVIVSVWILPVLGIMILLSARTFLIFIQNRERALSRGELESTQGRLIELIHMIPQAVYITFDYERETAFFSDKIKTITGYAPIELITDPKLWSQIIHPDDKITVQEKRYTLLKQKIGFSTEYKIRHKNGKWIHIRETASPIPDSSGNPSQIAGIIEEKNTNFQQSDTQNPENRPETTITKPEKQKNRSTGAPPRGNILLVDDDHLLVSLFSSKLEETGYGITTAYNGLEAVEAYSRHPEFFDLVILDMVMPKMSGLEAIEHLKKINPDVKIIGISGYSKDGREWNLSKQGILSFLSKPFEYEDLINSVNTVLTEK